MYIDEVKDAAIVQIQHALRLVQGGWVKGDFARTKDRECFESHPEACMFCLSGAMNRAELDLFYGSHYIARRNDINHVARTAVSCVIPARYSHNMVTFNDASETTLEMVIAVLKLAISRLEKDGHSGPLPSQLEVPSA